MNSTAPIKLFADAHVFDGHYQGSRTFIKEVYNLLSQKTDLELWLGAYDMQQLERHFPQQQNIHFVKYKTRSSVRRLLYEIPLLIKKNRIDYAHFQYIVPPVKTCRFIVTTHDVIFNEYPAEFSLRYRKSKTFLYKRSAKQADILSTVSEYSKNSIQKYLGIATDKIHVLQNGVNNAFFDRHDKAKAKAFATSKFGIDRFIFFVSRIEPRKNHLLLLRAFLELKLHQQGYHLFFAGSRSIATPEFDRLLESLPGDVKAFIVIRSNIDDDDLLQLYRAADIFVYPSKAEGFGIPPLEAAAARTTVLCSNSSAMNDFSFFGNNHFNPDDYINFKNRLAELVRLAPQQTDLANLSETVKQHYSWERSAEKLYQLIKNDHISNNKR